MTNDASDRLTSMVDPATTAVLTMEMQRGVIGEGALLPALAEQVAEAGIITNAAMVCDAARDAGARVVHCTAVSRPDGAGAVVNSRIFALAQKARDAQGFAPNELGRDGALLVPELGPDPRDIEVSRITGLTPFTSTSLDQTLRNLGIKTVVVTGVSVNLGVLGMCLSAHDLGYQVVLVRDAVTGVPVEYADAVIDNSLSLITTVTTAAEVCARWASWTEP